MTDNNNDNDRVNTPAGVAGCAGCAALREEVRRRNARLARVAEAGRQERLRFAQILRNQEKESEKLRSERDGLQQLLEEARAELQESAEEMAAAARFSETEWREHCDRVEGQCARLQKAVNVCLSAALEYLPHAEAAARGRAQEEAEAERTTFALPAYRRAVAAAQAAEACASAEVKKTNAAAELHFLCCSLDCTCGELRAKLRGEEGRDGPRVAQDTRAQARALWELYLTLRDVSFPSDTAISTLLEEEKNLTHLSFSTIPHEPTYAENDYLLTGAATSVYDFCRRLLRHLPRLQTLSLSFPPPLWAPEGRAWVAALPPVLEELHLKSTYYTVADVVALHKRCPGLQYLWLDTSRCTDWGEYAAVADTQERKRLVKEACGGDYCLE